MLKNYIFIKLTNKKKMKKKINLIDKFINEFEIKGGVDNYYNKKKYN